MPIKLYLIRHGIAADPAEYSDDELRPLTSQGHQKTEKVAKRLYHLGLRFDVILTSPLVRARQTAEILLAAGLSAHLSESPHLAPGGNLQVWLSWLEEWYDSSKSQLALVGHQPDLGDWAEMLVWGEVHEKLILKKAGIIGLTLKGTGSPIGQGQLFWLTPPKLLL